MDELTREDVAVAAGTTPETVTELARLGVLPSVGEGYVPPDIVRVRLALALQSAGIPLEELADAIREGRLSFDYVAQLMPDPVRLLPERHADLERSLGLPRDVADRLRAILGARVAPDEQARADDADLFALLARAREVGTPDGRLLAVVGAMAQAVQRLVQVQRDFIDDVLLDPALAEHGSPVKALAATSQTRLEFRRLGRHLISLLHERFVDDAVFQNLVQLTEAQLAGSGVVDARRRGAVVFVDVSGYTRIAEERGDEEAARQASLLTRFVQSIAADRGGHLVRAIGDGAMLHFDSPSQALRAALDAVEGASGRGVWPLHAGVSAGPMVRRDGDYFGTTVNVASRVADEAGPGQVVVTGNVVEAWDGAEDVRFTAMGEAALKNVARPVPLHRAERV